MVSLASICAAIVMVVALIFTETRPEVLWLGLGVSSFVIYAHRTNVRRILRGEEYRFGKAAPRADAHPNKKESGH
jgi:glycerol-3-phosphate acyltransferase PlsY